jgi:hypothetical protein
MNTVGEIKKEDFVGLDISNIAQNHRHGGKAMEKVCRKDIFIFLTRRK